jgi:peptidoglycan/xylan/chitin deacetylase (PgdA/CDA1 family)
MMIDGVRLIANKYISSGVKENMNAQVISERDGRDSGCALYVIYHSLTAFPESYSYAVETVTFRKHVELFVQLRNNEHLGLRPEVTFDDGHISDCEHALPILLSHDLKAQFFITAGWTGKKVGYMGWDEVRELAAAGQAIGAHGWSHRLLTHCSPKELRAEVVDSRAILEDHLGCPVTSMSLPGGRYNRRVLEACREAGYDKVFSSAPGAVRGSDGFVVGRMNVRADVSVAQLRELMRDDGGELDALRRRYQFKSLAKAALGDKVYAGIWRVMNRGGEES